MDKNRALIVMAWVLLATSTLANALCLWLWFADGITDRQMLGLTLFLSWLAIQGSAGTFLLQAYVKKDIDN